MYTSYLHEHNKVKEKEIFHLFIAYGDKSRLPQI